MAGEPELRLPDLTDNQYFGMDGFTFQKLCKEFSSRNRDWMRRAFPSPTTTWAYVTKNGEIIGHGEGILLIK